MNKDTELIWEAYNTGINPELNSILREAKEEIEKNSPTANKDVEAQKGVIDRMTPVDKLQAALDVVGLEPTVGTGADAVNIVISVGRLLLNALKGEKSEVKRHAINAGISAISLIPFGDVAKLLKLRTLARTGKAGSVAAKAGVGALKQAKVAGKGARLLKGRESEQQLSKSNPDAYAAYKAGSTLPTKATDATIKPNVSTPVKASTTTYNRGDEVEWKTRRGNVASGTVQGQYADGRVVVKDKKRNIDVAINPQAILPPQLPA